MCELNITPRKLNSKTCSISVLLIFRFGCFTALLLVCNEKP